MSWSAPGTPEIQGGPQGSVELSLRVGLQAADLLPTQAR